MIVMLPDGDDAQFYAVADQECDTGHDFSVWSWPAGEVIDVPSKGGVGVPAGVVDAVTRGTPVPRDGSLFGWLHQGSVSALVVIYSLYSEETPHPSWSVMPMSGAPADQWPPFTRKDLLGNWSWDYLRERALVSVGLPHCPDARYCLLGHAGRNPWIGLLRCGK